MPTIDLSQITIRPNRQRREFDPQHLQDLADSIRSNGLLQPIVLREEAEGFVLVAGETRMKAIRDIYELGDLIKFGGKFIPQGHIPFITMGQLSEIEAEEAELDENIRRKDLTWQEHAAAVERLHNLRVKQAAAKNETHTIAQTAAEIHGKSDGGYKDNLVRKDIILAKHLDKPEVAKAKSADEAFKVLKKLEERERNVELAATVGATFSAELHELYNADCIEWMEKYSGPGFDVILTDPPYGMGAHEFGDAAGKLANIDHQYNDSYENWQRLMQQWCPLSFKLAKPQAHAYVFCDIDRFHELKVLMEQAGWYVFRTPFTVFKTDSGRVPLPEMGPRRQSEWLLYAIKGKKPVTGIVGDVIPCQADANMLHGAQKPVALYQNLLQRSVRPGDTVLDSFGGTGTVIPAAHILKCKAVYVEMRSEYYAMGVKRAADLRAPTLMDLMGAEK